MNAVARDQGVQLLLQILIGSFEQIPIRDVLDLCLKPPLRSRTVFRARAHGMWTYEPRQGRKAATAVCSASAVVTLAFLFSHVLRFTPGRLVKRNP